MPEADEPFGQDVKEEAAQELNRIECHHTRLVAMRIIAPAEADALSIKVKQTMIGDRDTVGVAAKVAQHLQRATESRFGVDYPVLAAQTSHQFGELFGFAEHGRGSGVTELLASIKTLEPTDELAAKDTTQCFDRQKEPLARADPVLMIRREPSGRNHAVDMWLETSSRTIP